MPNHKHGWLGQFGRLDFPFHHQMLRGRQTTGGQGTSANQHRHRIFRRVDSEAVFGQHPRVVAKAHTRPESGRIERVGICTVLAVFVFWFWHG